MALAAIIYDKGFRIDDFMTRVATRLAVDGVRVRGLVQENFGDDPNSSVMVLVELASSGRFGISQDLGTQAQGCRLDPHGLADAGGRIDQELARGIDLLVLNKFGRAEAEQGAGLRSTVARAIESGIPVLTAVRPPYTAAWDAFHGGMSTALAPELETVLAWCRQAAAERRRGRDAAAPAQ